MSASTLANFLMVSGITKTAQEFTTVARLFRTFPAKLAEKFGKILQPKKWHLKHLFRHLLWEKTIHKNLKNC
jgi:hypothetical protein